MCDFAFVTPEGLELYKLQQPTQQGLHLVDKKAHGVKWMVYSHSARMVVLGLSDSHPWLQVGCVNCMNAMLSLSQLT